MLQYKWHVFIYTDSIHIMHETACLTLMAAIFFKALRLPGVPSGVSVVQRM